MSLTQKAQMANISTNISDASVIKSEANVTTNMDDAGSHVSRVMNITLLSIGVSTVLMNTFVICIMLMYKFMRSNANIVIGSMAVTDMLAGMVTITAGVVKWTDWFTNVQGLFCQVFFSIICFDIIYICSGITSGRVLDGELFTQRF